MEVKKLVIRSQLSTNPIQGYSWKTNQYGLSIDTIQSFELVLPTGSIIEVSTDSYPDLFFGLKVLVWKFNSSDDY